MKMDKSAYRSYSFSAIVIWCFLTLIILGSILFIGLRWGTLGYELFIQESVFTHTPTALASVSFSWLLAGWFLYLLHTKKLNGTNSLAYLGFFLVALLYLNVLRERFRYGDINYYIEAGTKLFNNQPLPDTYFYLPLWASLIKFLIPLGEDGILLVTWTLNVLSIFAFYFLLQRVLITYGFSPRLAAVVTTAFMLVNTPLMRTLMYVQVNLHVMNAIFLSLLLYRRSPFFSALMLALAVHLKSSPVVLVLAFLLERDWRWLLWFVLGNLALGAITILGDGFTPFWDVFNNVTALASQRNAIFHDTSFDSFFGFPSEVFAVSKPLVRGLVYASKGLLGIAVLALTFKAARTKPFLANQEHGTRVHNSIIPLFILMNLASPVVWVHHGIFLTISFLVLPKQLDTPSQWTWFGLAYLLEFIIPTFDFYPWSYGRLIAPLICLGLLWQVSRGEKVSSLFERTNQWLESLPGISNSKI